MGWQTVPFGSLGAHGSQGSFALGPFGSKVTTKDYVSSGVPFIRGVNLSNGLFCDDNFVFIDEAVAKEVMSANVSPGDLIFTRKGTIGQVSMIPRKSRFPGYVISSSQMKASLDEKTAVPEFYYYWFRSPQGQRALLANASQVGVPSIANSLATLRGIFVPVPPQGEQQAIAEVLGALDDKIALNERIRETTLHLASACYEASDAGAEPELLGDLAELFDGPHATPRKTDAGPWFLSISSLRSGYLDLTESAHLSEEDFPRWTRRVQPQAGDVLFSYETRLGDAALMPAGVRGSLGRRMALLRSRSASVSGSLLLHAYLSPAFQGEVGRRTIYGATVDRLPLKEMPNWRIRLPAEGERERLSAKLDALHACVTQTADENRTLADLRDTLLPQLLSGKLRIKDVTRAVEAVV